MNLVGLLPLMVTLGAGTPPSLAVFGLQPAEGISEGVAKLLTDTLTQEFRVSRAFSKVVSSSEIEAIVGFERTRQVASCDNGGCAAELANALGVDLIAMGSVGRIGTSVLLNVKLINVTQGTTVASVAQRIPGGTEEALLDSLPRAVHQVLYEAGLATAPIAPVPPPVSAPPPSAPAPAPVPALALAPPVVVVAPPVTKPEAAKPAAAPAEPEPASSWSIPLAAGGAAVLLLGGLAIPVSALASVAAFPLSGAGAFVVMNRALGFTTAQANPPANVA
jgi:hypothetical protein